MSLFRFPWLRRLVRRHTAPIEEDRAAVWKRRISVAYALVAWNAFGFVCYMIYHGKADWAKYYGLKSEEELHMSSGKQFAKLLGIEKATIYKVSGLNITSEEYGDVDEKKETDVMNT